MFINRFEKADSFRQILNGLCVRRTRKFLSYNAIKSSTTRISLGISITGKIRSVEYVILQVAMSFLASKIYTPILVGLGFISPSSAIRELDNNFIIFLKYVKVFCCYITFDYDSIDGILFKGNSGFRPPKKTQI